MSLWEHVADVENIADLVDALDRADELTPEVSEDLQKALIAAICGTKDKIDRSTSVLARFEAAEAAAKLERDRLDARVKYFARQAERLSEYLLAVLTASKLDRIDGETSSIQRRKNPARVEIEDEDAIPFDFLRFPPEPPPPPPVPDKKAIAAALKLDPESVPGARLVQTFKLVRS
jgi:hypothetical protein